LGFADEGFEEGKLGGEEAGVVVVGFVVVGGGIWDEVVSICRWEGWLVVLVVVYVGVR
jgi:uncharacterized protein (DUF983 family)